MLIVIILILGRLGARANDTLRMSDDEVRRWFEENEIRDTATTDTTAYELLPDSVSIALSAGDSVWLSLLTIDDLVQIHAHAVERTACNPLFIDEWVASTVRIGERNNETVTELRRRAQQAVFREYPDVYTYHESQLPNIEEIKRRRMKVETNQISVDVIPTIKIDKLAKIKPAKSPWTYGGDAQVQFSQNYYSDNWYTGGESSLAAYFFFKGKVNYSSHKIQWDSQLDAKFSFNTAASDTLRKIRTNDDLVRLTSKLGVQAFKSDKWFYSADFELSTTLFNTYVKNTYERVTGPASPLRLYLSLGFDFKYKNELSVQMLPFSYKMLHVADTAKHIGVTQSIADKQGIPVGQKTKNDVGSKVKVRWEHSFMREIKLETTFSLYTNYRGVEVDWEVIGYFIINRFLSARVSLNPRYDSTVELPDGEDPRLQFKELVSVGFHYKF
ncbi:MAG: DUF3078 domain-containing protein [Paludibacteraceae bacterium]